VQIVVLTKPVPDPAAAAEKLGPDNRLDRAASPAVINGNDEYTLEAALRLADQHGAEVTLLAMGAHRGVLITDPALAGSDASSTWKVLAAALRQMEFDLVLAGFDSSDGVAGVTGAAIATALKLPYLSSAASIEPLVETESVRVKRISASGFDVLEAKLPAVVVGTQLLGAPRYPSLKGIMGARSKEIVQKSLADLGLSPDDVGGSQAKTTVTGKRTPPARGAAKVVKGTPEEAAQEIVALLAERRLI